MGELEKERLARESSLGPDIRLSCQVAVESDLTIRVLSRASETGMTAGPRPAN
jgi:ferredoxin